MRITRTSKALVVKCKCENTIAFHGIIGGIDIDAEFTDTIAQALDQGGQLQLLDMDQNGGIYLEGCNCNNE